MSQHWKRMGGGCLVLGDGLYPCDDEYENEATGETVFVRSTQERHSDMPRSVDGLATLMALDGVQDNRSGRDRRQTYGRREAEDGR